MVSAPCAACPEMSSGLVTLFGPQAVQVSRNVARMAGSSSQLRAPVMRRTCEGAAGSVIPVLGVAGIEGSAVADRHLGPVDGAVFAFGVLIGVVVDQGSHVQCS